MRQKDGRDQDSHYKQRYLKKIQSDTLYPYESCQKKAIWFVVKLNRDTDTSSIELCNNSMKLNYERCQSHQLIKTKYLDEHIEVKNKYCTVVYPKNIIPRVFLSKNKIFIVDI